MTRRRLIACVSVAALGLMLLVGAAVAGLIVMRRPSLASAGECVQAVEELPLAPLPEYRSLPPLEVVRVDWPTAKSSGAWRHWRAGPTRAGALALDPAGDVLWLAAGADPARWDLNTSQGALVNASCHSCGDIAAIVPTGPEQLWAVATWGYIYRYDQGGLAILSGNAYWHSSDVEAGVDGSGTLWMNNASESWERCTGYPTDWRCERGWEWQEPPLTQAMGCTSLLGSLDVNGFWSCATAPGRTEHMPLDPPPCDDWQSVSGSMRCVTWDQDCAGQLVLLSLDPREVERTVPWPGGVNLTDVHQVTHNEDQVWLFSDALWMLEAGRWQRFDWPYDAPSGLVADPAGDGVWVTVPALGLLHVSADAVRMHHPRDSLYALPVDRDWTPIWREPPGRQLATLSLAETADGRIWAGTDGGGLWVYDEAEALWQPTELTQAFVDALEADGDGGLWIGTRYGGVAHHNGDDGWQWWRTYDGLPSDRITGLALDQQGRVWAGTADAGLVRSDGHLWEEREIDDVEPNDRITALVADQRGSVYFGHSRGVGVCEGEQCRHSLTGETLGGHIATLALNQSGDLWASDGHVIYERASMGAWRRRDELERQVNKLLPDSRGLLWVGGIGLKACSLSTENWFWFPLLGEMNVNVYDLLEDRQGRIWVAWGHGVSMYDPALGAIEE